MTSEEQKFIQVLNELLILLKKADEFHWDSYFSNVLKLAEEGKTTSAYKNAFRAYGGMGSFNDIPLNLSLIHI